MTDGWIILNGMLGMIVTLGTLLWFGEENEPWMIRFRQRAKEKMTMKLPRWLTRDYWLRVEHQRRTKQPWRPEYERKRKP